MDDTIFISLKNYIKVESVFNRVRNIFFHDLDSIDWLRFRFKASIGQPKRFMIILFSNNSHLIYNNKWSEHFFRDLFMKMRIADMKLSSVMGAIIQIRYHAAKSMSRVKSLSPSFYINYHKFKLFIQHCFCLIKHTFSYQDSRQYICQWHIILQSTHINKVICYINHII